MTRDDLVNELRAAMRRNTITARDWDAVTERDRLDSLGLDSLAMLDMAYDIQNEIGIDVDIEDLAEVSTVGELVDRLLASD